MIELVLDRNGLRGRYVLTSSSRFRLLRVGFPGSRLRVAQAASRCVIFRSAALSIRYCPARVAASCFSFLSAVLVGGDR